MTIYDISLTISPSLVVWENTFPVELSQPNRIDRGDMVNLTKMNMSVHTGTHVDAPSHFLRGGAGVETLDLTILVGPALVVEALDIDVITAEVLERLDIPAGVSRILFHTRNSNYWREEMHRFTADFVAISEDGARWLVERGFKLVGVDYLSVAPFDAPIPTHCILLENGVIPVEGLNLNAVPAGMYDLYCLPLKILESDGAPARAILMKQVK